MEFVLILNRDVPVWRGAHDRAKLLLVLNNFCFIISVAYGEFNKERNMNSDRHLNTDFVETVQKVIAQF